MSQVTKEASRGAGMLPEDSLVAWHLSAGIAVLMLLQSVTGLVLPELYRDVDWVTAAWYGNDFVTALVAVPLMVWALMAVRRGSRRAELVWYSMLGYCVYNYAFYLFGAQLNWFFPVYAVLFAMPVFALILALSRVDAVQIASEFSGKTPIKWISGYMLFTGIGLAIAWIVQWLNFMLTGAVPDVGEEGFRLIASLDLSYIVPWFILGAVLLLRRQPWGYIIAMIITMKGATYTLVLTSASTVGALRGIEGSLEQIPVWAAWTLAGGLAVWGLLRNLQPAAKNGT